MTQAEPHGGRIGNGDEDKDSMVEKDPWEEVNNTTGEEPGWMGQVICWTTSSVKPNSLKFILKINLLILKQVITGFEAGKKHNEKHT